MKKYYMSDGMWYLGVMGLFVIYYNVIDQLLKLWKHRLTLMKRKVSQF